MQPGVISLVLPTFNRAMALRENLPIMLALEEVGEIIVVNDGSTDETLEVCRQFTDERLRVISHSRNLGVATARNTGVRAAVGEWVLFGEDDCRFPADYAAVLRAEAESHDGDIIGAPMVHHRGSDESVAEFAASLPRVSVGPSLEQVDVFVTETIETPFLCALALIRRTVFDRVQFYEGYPHNGYREETDFYIQAVRAGFQCLLTSATYSYELARWSGGQHHASTLRYEYWLLRNNWHFLQRHGHWMTERGYIRGVRRTQARFAAQRVGEVSSGFLGARFGQIRAAISGSADASSG